MCCLYWVRISSASVIFGVWSCQQNMNTGWHLMYLQVFVPILTVVSNSFHTIISAPNALMIILFSIIRISGNCKNKWTSLTWRYACAHTHSQCGPVHYLCKTLYHRTPVWVPSVGKCCSSWWVGAKYQIIVLLGAIPLFRSITKAPI